MEDRELSGRRAAFRASCLLALLSLAASAEPAAEESGAEPPAAQDAEAAGAPAAVDLHRLHLEAAESFYSWDGDRDGFVAALEAIEMTPERFAGADRDRDGRLSLVEWVDARFAETSAPGVPPAGER